MTGWLTCFIGIVQREGLRFVHQRARFLSALARPLVWLFIFAAGFRAVLGLSISPPYETYILYEVYIIPGLCAMIQLFQGMQSGLSMVYDRESGSMRALLVSPYPRWFLLMSKLCAAVAVSIAQVYAFLLIAGLYGVRLSPTSAEVEVFSGVYFPTGVLTVFPALVLSGFLCAAAGLALSSMVRQLENFAGVMNFVIFPTFFCSSALYPLWKVREGSPVLADIAAWNPFTGAVELIRHALYLRLEAEALAITAAATLAFLLAALWAYDPSRGVLNRKR